MGQLVLGLIFIFVPIGICCLIDMASKGQRDEYMKNWKPNPGVEKYPNYRADPLKRPWGYDPRDPYCKCERCGSTNVTCDSDIEIHKVTAHQITKKYTCLYCGHIRGTSTPVRWFNW